MKEERKSIYGKKLQEAKDVAVSSLVKIEIKLSDKIIWWECPTVCRWEPWEESDEFFQLHPKIQDYNINYEKYAKREQEKLFKVPDQHLNKRKIQIEDFQLSAYPKDLKLSSLVEKFLAPLIPDEYFLHSEAVEFYETKQVAWKFYVDHLRAMQYRSEKIDKIMKLDEFLNLFEMKNLPPRSLFPSEICKRITTIANFEEAERVKIERDKLMKKNKPEINVNIGENFPMKEEPLMVSELIARFDDFQRKLKPNFLDVHVTIFENEQKKKKTKDLKKDITRKSRSSLSASRKSTIVTKKSKLSVSTPSSQDNLKENEVSGTSTPPAVVDLVLIPHHKGKWSTRDIHEQSYDDENKTITFFAGRLGNFGLVTKKFLNLPLKSWEMFPIIQKKMEKFVMMKIEAQNATIEFKITGDGYTFNIIKPLKAPIQEIKKPVKIVELKKVKT